MLDILRVEDKYFSFVHHVLMICSVQSTFDYVYNWQTITELGYDRDVDHILGHPFPTSSEKKTVTT